MLKIALLLLLTAIFYQDLKMRAVHWICFPLVLAAALAFQGDRLNFTAMLFSFTFLAGMLFFLTIYVSLRTGQMTDITKAHFSWGDILFLLAVIPLFDFKTYVLFFTAGTFLSLLIHLLVSRIQKQPGIPYAGYMAFVAIACICLEGPLNQFMHPVL